MGIMKIYPPVGGGSATTDASLLTSGTLPLARLSGITTTELDAAAGIVSGQIAELSLSKLTAGTLIPGLILDYGSAAGTGTVTAGSNQIFNASTGLQINAQSGNTVEIMTAGTARLTVAADILTTSVPIKWSTVKALTGSDYSIGKHSNTQLAVNVPSNSQFAVYINGANIQLFSVNGIDFLTNAGVVSAGNRMICPVSTGLTYNVPTGTSHVFAISNNTTLNVTNTGLTTIIPLIWTTNVTLNGANYTIGRHSSTLLAANVPTGGTFAILINTAPLLTASSAGLTIGDAVNIVTNSTTGAKLCTAANQKLGFWNATPIVQPAGANQAAITDSTGGTAGFTLSDVTITPTQALINNNFASLNRQVDAIRTALVNAGLIKGAA